ncbi:unnamed protein product [marine sediment metagenome]|uniref:Ribbon-helix-helix protein CopG domain-containing protein n=1 Tax=marine sediment metagenome TaxID=412755 RepID=X1ESM9_9ZZZZ
MDMNECMSDKATRVRITLTLTKVYVDALDRLVEEGLYMEHQVAIRDALRHLFQFHGIESFADMGAEADAPSEP